MVVDDQQNKMLNEITRKVCQKKRIFELTDIQLKAIPYINTNDNLVIVAPSGAGKTLVAELIALLDFLNNNKKITSISNLSILSNQNFDKKSKTIFLVPLRALADEKARTFSLNYQEYKLKVHLSMSEVDFNEEKISNCDILISTYERFRTILGRVPNLIDFIKNVVIDEFHLIGDKNRGPVLEAILTSLIGNVRLILLSATIENPNDIAKWLEAKLIYSEKRFVPLEFDIITTLYPEEEIEKSIKRSISNNSQILIFSGTRIKAEENAIKFADFIYNQCKNDVNFNQNEIKAFLEKYSIPKDTIGNKLLYDLVQKGTAFHHAGLSSLAKKIIEELFRKRWIKVLFCTETLGAGINLPAREVMILDIRRWNNEWLSRNVLHQIAGRAGRPNLDTYGKCTILAVDYNEKKLMMKRYWKNDSKDQSNFSLINLKPRFDEITSKIHDLEEFERMILTLINNKSPKKDELINLLMNSYYNYMNWNKNYEGEKIDDYIRLFYELIVDFNENSILDLLSLLQKKYITSSMKIGEIFEDNVKQIIEILEEKNKSFITLRNKSMNCSCNLDSIFCNHMLFIIQQMPKKQACLILENKFSILKNLITNNYINEKSSGKLQTSIKGKIWVEMGLARRQFEYIQQWIMYDLFSKGTSVSKIIKECLQVMTKINEQDIHLNYPNFIKPIYDFVVLKKDFLKTIMKYNLYEGDLFRVLISLKSFITGLIPLADFLGLMNTKQLLETVDLLIIDTIYRK